MKRYMKAIVAGMILATSMIAYAENPEPTKAEQSDTVKAVTSSDSAVAVAPKSHKVVAYYFHGNKRCVSCRKIEAYTKAAIDSAFVDGLKSGELEWQVVNTDSSQNEHYLGDYKMYTKAVILSDLHDGKEARWKNLEKVWELLGDQKEFAAYIKSELDLFMDKTK